MGVSGRQPPTTPKSGDAAASTLRHEPRFLPFSPIGGRLPRGYVLLKLVASGRQLELCALSSALRCWKSKIDGGTISDPRPERNVFHTKFTISGEL